MSVFPSPATSYSPVAFRQKLFFITLIIVSAFILTVIGLYSCIAWIVAHPKQIPVRSNPMLSAGLPYESVSFPSIGSPLQLDGWYIPSRSFSTKTVIFSHSYGGNREEPWMPMYKFATALHNQNYNVLMFDYAYVNPANRLVFTGGVQESKQLLGAVAYSKSHGASETIVWGFSMGAGTALQAALYSPDIQGMILDSTFLTTPATTFHNVKQTIDLPRFPSVDMFRLIFPFINGISFAQIPYEEVMNTLYKMPIFFIHGQQDERAPYHMIVQLAQKQSADPLSSIWLNPQAKHELNYGTSPTTYMAKTMAFLQKVTNKLTALPPEIS